MIRISLPSQSLMSLVKIIALAIIIFISNFAFVKFAHADANLNPNIWWPTNGAKIDGLVPFKADVPGKSVNDYYLFWQVDGGAYVWMDNNSTDYPHKESQVDVSGWNWSADGAYYINFIAQDLSGHEIGRSSTTIYHGGVQKIVATSVTTTTPVTQSAVNILAATNIQVVTNIMPSMISSSKLYVDPTSKADAQAFSWRNSRPDDASVMQKIASQSTAIWLTGSDSNVTNKVSAIIFDAQNKKSIPTFVLYNVPGRDCGGFSAGGAQTKDAYLSWVQNVSKGIGSGEAIVILEPDGLANIDCLSNSEKADRFAEISGALDILKTNSKAKVYIDAGNPNWIGASEMAGRLQKAGISKAAGFSLNVSNYIDTTQNISYGTKLSSLTNGAHFVIDTSRNGSGSNGEWCNASGRSLGSTPTLSTGNNLVDAYLWIKVPGESDGNCNGGPNAGVWWSDYALDLAKRAGY